MSEYDLTLDNLLGICKLTIESINERTNPRGDQCPKIVTHLNDVCENIQFSKEEIDKFETTYDEDTRARLLLQSTWKLKRDPKCDLHIQDVDLRDMTVLYYLTVWKSFTGPGKRIFNRVTIDTFLKEFE